MTAPTLSIVIPLYREAAQLEAALAEIRIGAAATGMPFELVLVNDGSPDATWPAIKRLARIMPEIRALSLSRNFGKEAAISAGLDTARGRVVIVMDGDLQHPPALIPRMVELWRHGGSKIVNAVKIDRGREGTLRRVAARLFYSVFERLSGRRLADSSDFKLLDREVVEIYRRLPERAKFFRGLVSWIGFVQTDVPFEVPERAAGRSSWSTAKLTRLAIDAITSFSAAPLQIVTIFGALFLLGALGLGAHTLYRFAAGSAIEGFTTVILLLLSIGAAVMISLGILGQYIARIYDEVKQRPRYLVEDRIAPSDKELKAGKTAAVEDVSGRRGTPAAQNRGR
jgi:polyisoprenyl-phosphate glycosyltransferase